jgi:secondary thiamine-phosphate synthase enzyme
MKHHRARFEVRTRGRGLHDVTDRVSQAVRESGVREGLATVFVHHTSASLIVQENADPQVQRDLDAFFARLVPDGDPIFRHTDEGKDDMPAHVRAAITQTSIGIPIEDAALALGTWQGIYVWEHRLRPYERRVTVTILGD